MAVNSLPNREYAQSKEIKKPGCNPKQGAARFC